jgi:hypothetical protein
MTPMRRMIVPARYMSCERSARRRSGALRCTSPDQLLAQRDQKQGRGDILKHLKALGLTELSLPLLGLGGLIFVWQLFRFRLVPRLISVA